MFQRLLPLFLFISLIVAYTGNRDFPDPGPDASSNSSGGEVICLPGGASGQAEAESPLPELVEGPMPDHSDSVMNNEDMAALALVDYKDVTHAAVQDGRWCDPETWHNRQVPGEGARVVIPENRMLIYDVISEVSLKTLRIDGELRFSPDASSRLILDTLFVDPRGTLVIGTEDRPIQADAFAQIVIASDGDIDTGWDPQLLSRGIVTHGRTIIYGARKTSHLPVDVDPAAGDDTLAMQRAPGNWCVGDTIVVAGTRYSGWKWDNSVRKVRYHGTSDEVRTIAAINGNLVTLDRPLEYDHFSPRADLKTRVANFTRNVSIISESGGSLPHHQRGHVMFMHSPDVDVKYAEFRNLGRTDKSIPSFQVDDINNVEPDSNVQGRYSFHFHRTGTDDQEKPAIAVGNAVFGSPGWGYAHHDSHAYLYDNVSFDTFGAGFVAETGNETGAWVNNLAIRAEGNKAFNPKNGNDLEAFDMARTGDGFWFQGRMLRAVDNIAASVNHGFVYLHRGSGMLDFPADHFMLPEALGYGRPTAAGDIPIRNFHGNEAFASTVGFFVVKANPMQRHDIYTELTEFTAWEVQAGVAIEYASHYLLRDFDLVSSTPEQYRKPKFAIAFGTNTTDMVVRDARIDGFPDGIRLHKNHTENNQSAVGKDQFVVIGGEYIATTNELVDYDPSVDTVIESDELNPGEFRVELDNGDRFEYLDPSTTAGSGVAYSGEKVDSIGSNPLPGGGDELEMPFYDMIALLERDGYYRTESGEPYAIVEQYFSDRATGEIHKYGRKTFLGPEVEAAIDNGNSSWGGAVYRGSLDLSSRAPMAHDDSAQTPMDTAVAINLLANDADEDGDPLAVDGIVQPRHGTVFDEGSGTVIYHPDIGFIGTDSFKYWVTDGQGNFTPAQVEVTVN